MGKFLPILSRVSLFRDLPEADLLDLERLLRIRTFPKESVIINRDDSGNSLYILASGSVKVVIYGDSGREVILNWFGPGDFFGEMSLLDGKPRSASVIASEDTTLLALDRDSFLQHVRRSPAVAFGILRELTGKLREATDMIADLALLDVYGRITHVLRDQIRTRGRETPDGILLSDPLTHQEIASMAGTSRETVSRILKQLERQGLLSKKGRRLVVRRHFVVQP